MEDLENHLARLGYRREARDQEYWHVAQVNAPQRKRSRRQGSRGSIPRATGRGRNLYLRLLQASRAPTEPYRVTRLAE